MFKKITKIVEGTDRIGNFSDSIFGFSMTLLVMDITIPPLDNPSNKAIIEVLIHQSPKFISFLFSFLVVAIIWVNHHHFFHNFKRVDWKLLWYNVAVLFWVIMIPFTTGFIGDHPFQPIVVAIYAVVMFFVVFHFMLMVRYVFFKSALLEMSIPLDQRKKELRRVWPAIIIYGIATVSALIYVPFALALLFFVPVFYFVPSLIPQMDS